MCKVFNRISEEEMTDIEKFMEWQGSPVSWVRDMFSLSVPKLKKGYVIGDNTRLEEVRCDWFEVYESGITWQQYVILLAVERAVAGKGRKFLSISSGRGIGKTCVLSWLILWGLFCYKGSQIPCTANTVQQLYDVLWKEVSIWHEKLPEWAKSKYLLEKDYVRFEDTPGSGKNWFARAATAKKETPEALSGVHSSTLVMVLVDESSAVADEVFETGEGSMTNENVLMVLISNYTRLEGYFHESQVNEHGLFQVLSFNSEESPVVNKDFLERAALRGKEGDYYRVHVLGKPPKEILEDSEWEQLIVRPEYTLIDSLTQPIIMGVDPSGAGRNSTSIVIRDAFKAKVIGTWEHLSPLEILEKIIETQKQYKILGNNIIVDGFGIGMHVLQEAIKAKIHLEGVLVGDPSKERRMFANQKAEYYWRLREWVLSGGKFIGTDIDWKAITKIFYRADSSNRIEMMGKKEIVKKHLKDIDTAEALMLTFSRTEWSSDGEIEEEKGNFDRFSLFD